MYNVTKYSFENEHYILKKFLQENGIYHIIHIVEFNHVKFSKKYYYGISRSIEQNVILHHPNFTIRIFSYEDIEEGLYDFIPQIVDYFLILWNSKKYEFEDDLFLERMSMFYHKNKDKDPIFFRHEIEKTHNIYLQNYIVNLYYGKNDKRLFIDEHEIRKKVDTFLYMDYY